MAGIVSATSAQCLTARNAALAFQLYIQQFAQGTLAPTTLSAEQITEVDALVDTLVAALAPLNT